MKQKYINQVMEVVGEDRTKNVLNKIQDKDLFNNFTDYKLKTLASGIENVHEKLQETMRLAEIDAISTEKLDIEDLRKDYVRKGLNKIFPDLDLERLKELFENPPESLKSPAYKKHIIYDRVIVRKYVIAVMQMLFSQMDLVVTFCGREGTGKTTASTQDAYLVYYILNEIKVIDYPFTLKEIMSFNLKNLIDSMNKNSQNPFRVFILDEGNELNRKEWSNPIVSLFFQKLRRERKHLRIIFINLPQLGELLPSITLSRVNFVFQLGMKGDLRTKLATKGQTYFYIIPRFGKIYSYLNKKNLYQDKIINELGKILDDKKKYLQKLPMYLAVHKFRRNGVWAFNESEYDRMSKKANDDFSTIGASLTRQEIFYLFKYLNMRKMGIKSGTNAYFCLTNLKNKKLNRAVNSDENIGMMESLDDNDKEDEEKAEE